MASRKNQGNALPPAIIGQARFEKRARSWWPSSLLVDDAAVGYLIALRARYYEQCAERAELARQLALLKTQSAKLNEARSEQHCDSAQRPAKSASDGGWPAPLIGGRQRENCLTWTLVTPTHDVKPLRSSLKYSPWRRPALCNNAVYRTP